MEDSDSVVEAEHRQWLAAYHPQHLRNWEKLFKDDPEAAMCEASVRRLLCQCGITAEPNEDLTGSERRPDFRCFQSGHRFFVEVTCISIDTATKTTGLPHVIELGKALMFRQLNDAIFKACKGKASQCGGVDHPVLVAVGTFHGWASMVCFNKQLCAEWLLTGEPKLAWYFDTQAGQAVGDEYQITEFYSAAFLRPDKLHGVDFARSSISGLLLCGFGCEPAKVLGVLHPDPARHFDPRLLRQIPFCSVQLDKTSGKIWTTWTGGNEE